MHDLLNSDLVAMLAFIAVGGLGFFGIFIFGLFSAVILKATGWSPLWAIPLSILQVFGVVVAIAMAMIPKSQRDEEELDHE
ncbi:hypothetical protein FGU71_08480 [Erythrobacter insulae]|uniref:Uncharacterized protein n=1 Tax=Erythrobacter insulae TaxID=2584124 RepID=A0A547PCL4_9SPHN|nr:hypothetical protein [Erythrobacter insulae]TRD11887.1 hypothetical protein FGU71_08480 [Erythrobacter insulae]